MKLVLSIILFIVATESEPTRAAVQTGRKAEGKAVNETDTKAKALMADFLRPSLNLPHREAISALHRQEADDTSCDDLIPGLKLFQSGVDGARLDLMGLGQNERGFLSPVVHFTCQKGKKTRIPLGIGKEYDEPDQIDGVTAIPAGWTSDKADIMKSRSDVSKFISVNGGFGDALGLFKLSASYSKMTSMVNEKKEFVASSKKVVPMFTARMVPFNKLKVTDSIQAYIEDDLTSTFEEDPEPYRLFISFWGTHFFHNANFGGVIQVLLEMDASFAEKQSQKAIGAQASGIIKGFSLGGGVESKSDSMNSDFRKHTSVTKLVLGGHLKTFLKEGFKSWQPTVAEAPWLFRGKLVSIHLLFKDKEKRKEMKKAIDEHMMKAQLKAAQRMARMKLPSLVGDISEKEEKLKSYIDKCTELMDEDFPQKKEVQMLNKKIDEAMKWKKDCRLEDNVQYQLHDYKTVRTKLGVNECKKLCINDYPTCVGFTFDKRTDKKVFLGITIDHGTGNAKCWLKTKMAHRTENKSWAQSGVCISGTTPGKR